jgi:hypothetical protein
MLAMAKDWVWVLALQSELVRVWVAESEEAEAAKSPVELS